MHGMTNGNMGSVYRRFSQIAAEAEIAVNRHVAQSDGIDAEITEGSTGDWFLVQTFPGDDVRAMRWLTRRKFGLFRPMQQRRDKRNGKPVQGWEPAFPGWLFVYVWDIKKHMTRLRNIPGVMDIFCDPVTLQPVRVNQMDSQGEYFIDKLRDESWVYEENAPRLRRHTPAAGTTSTAAKVVRSGPRRPTLKERKTLDRLKNDFKARQLEWDESAWSDANKLEPHLRIALLQRTLRNAPPLQVAPRS